MSKVPVKVIKWWLLQQYNSCIRGGVNKSRFIQVKPVDRRLFGFALLHCERSETHQIIKRKIFTLKRWEMYFGQGYYKNKAQSDLLKYFFRLRGSTKSRKSILIENVAPHRVINHFWGPKGHLGSIYPLNQIVLGQNTDQALLPIDYSDALVTRTQSFSKESQRVSL